MGVEYDTVEYQQGPAPDFSRADWMDKKHTLGLPFPNLPYLMHGDLKLTETMAIHKYLAEVYDQTLLGKNATDKARVTMFGCVIGEMKNKITPPCYMSGDKNEIIEEYTKRLPPILANKGDHQFLIGDYPTYIDFYFFEMIELLKFLTEGAVIKEFPALESYVLRMKALNGLKEYLADPSCHDVQLDFNNVVAKLNGKQSFM